MAERGNLPAHVVKPMRIVGYLLGDSVEALIDGQCAQEWRALEEIADLPTTHPHVRSHGVPMLHILG